mmetsp:Transcript_9006/g.20317  ORF Transcript_9006/g.20317 Transcript_9006/m.20317 type:complete len:117 (-) Transcript_9006:220-570(-)|eukprot:CAMPEP_0172311862 /NCGR_PEP_ID=MMETSP1058-20130122/15816_1 /TAXON_ID=83371 /ORGANISM="Detonula confervacea, Strain CCMP 353" /LENGTH=116 /DNA_ID=CAMNT_0013025157 /DNA_START=19 /DNA_END=369 /DNA_ORIENTATION=+
MGEIKGMEALGVIGGTSIALSLIPQVIKTYKTKSAGDISYVYQAIYIFGCSLVNTYAIALNLWPVYVPCLIEEALIITLTVMKYVYASRNGIELKEEEDKANKTERKSSEDGGADM